MTHMVYLPFSYAALGQWSGRRRLMRQGVFDEGYALHVLLSGVFGKGVLQPFRTFRPSRAQEATLYAYSDLEERTLRAVSEVAAPPDCLEVIDVAGLRAKPMPARFSVGQRLGFDIRVRPVRRLAQNLPDSQSAKVIRKGSEIDAFRLELLRRSPNGWKDREVAPEAGISREEVYAKWLAERLTGAAAVDLHSCRLASFRRLRVIRGDGCGPEGPDSVLHGECVVEDPAAFAATLAKGVGRHRAYGYGMLIVRPPDTSPRSG
ncbi:type I-E CRISPR-associated protein Cas6/Cse3/CasE [Candidatus Palauibacter sp.]|uniref:type I-E CRISPR-associated protein Cas6/Cse3/CasE n=1 Tax=Candidatus Palauibacter sp. TaxID=3101350 RepID=UPI003B519C21